MHRTAGNGNFAATERAMVHGGGNQGMATCAGASGITGLGRPTPAKPRERAGNGQLTGGVTPGGLTGMPQRPDARACLK